MHQLTARLLHFDTGDASDDEEVRKRHVRDFEDKVLGFLRFCDPESSPFAWFLWHATQCHVAIMHVAKVRPLSALQTINALPLVRACDEGGEFLYMSLRVLEKTQLIHLDSRGARFRWYARIPWSMLVAAMLDFSVCTDATLVRRGFPVLQWWYDRHQGLIAERGNDPSNGIVTKAMQHCSFKVATLLQTAVISGDERVPTQHSGFDVFYTTAPQHELSVNGFPLTEAGLFTTDGTQAEMQISEFDASLPWLSDGVLDICHLTESGPDDFELHREFP